MLTYIVRLSLVFDGTVYVLYNAMLLNNKTGKDIVGYSLVHH